MANETVVLQLQEHIGYSFKKPSLLQLALTAAGAEETNYDGNRRLAQLGESLITAVLCNTAFSKGVSRGKTTHSLWDAIEYSHK